MTSNVRTDDRPQSVREFQEWYRVEFGERLEEQDRDLDNWYTYVCDQGAADLKESPFWKALQEARPSLERRYRLRHGPSTLWVSELQPKKIGNKKLESAIDKSFRQNVVHNEKPWPTPPELKQPVSEGATPQDYSDPRLWVGPRNWLTEFSDIYRVRFIANYIDGVLFLTEQISELAEKDAQTECSVDLKNTPHGYFASHLDIQQSLLLPDFETKEESEVAVTLEVQITTAIQSTLLEIQHELYSLSRLNPDPTAWQWQYKDPEFHVNYMGSTLHLLEGLIVKARDDRRDQK